MLGMIEYLVLFFFGILAIFALLGLLLSMFQTKPIPDEVEKTLESTVGKREK